MIQICCFTPLLANLFLLNFIFSQVINFRFYHWLFFYPPPSLSHSPKEALSMSITHIVLFRFKSGMAAEVIRDVRSIMRSWRVICCPLFRLNANSGSKRPVSVCLLWRITASTHHHRSPISNRHLAGRITRPKASRLVHLGPQKVGKSQDDLLIECSCCGVEWHYARIRRRVYECCRPRLLCTERSSSSGIHQNSRWTHRESASHRFQR